MSDDIYSLYGSAVKESSSPVSASYSSNIDEVKQSKNDIQRRKKEASEDVSPVRVGETASQVVESMGNVEPPLGEAIAGTGKNLAENLSPYALPAAGVYGLYKLWQNFSKPNDGGTPPAQPAAAPEGQPVAPKTAAEAPVQPMSRLDELKIQKAEFELEAAKAKEARAAEAHASRLAAEAKRGEMSLQKKSSGGISPEDRQMLISSEKAKIDKAVEASQKAAAKAVAPAPVAAPAPAPVAAPVQPAAQAPAAPVAPPKVEASGLTKEQKGMKNYLVSQYGGGPEGEAAYKKVIDILGEVPAYEKGQGGGLTKEANEAIKAWRKTNIEGPKVNLTHDMKKAMKGAGGVAILAAIPGFAEAAQRKDYGAMSDIASDFFVLPFAQSREAGMPKAQEESIIASKFKEASKLGSPYRSVPPPR